MNKIRFGDKTMARPLQEIEKEALALPSKKRATLAEHLLATLDNSEDVDAEELWLAQAERRYQEYRAGKIKARASNEVLDKARRELR
jgi:putative addiction module component (TIGR02574 family)